MKGSYQWAFKHMIRSERVHFLSNIRFQDILIDIEHVRWQNLRRLDVSKGIIISLERFTWMDMPSL